MRKRLTIGLGGTLLLAATPAGAAPPAGLSLEGAVSRPGTVGPAELTTLPQLSLPVVQGTEHGLTRNRYAGVLLWDLLQRAGPRDDPKIKHAGLRHTVLVTGRDGYAVAFSFGELDPAAGAEPVMVIQAAHGLDLVVPGDHAAARDVHDVARIEVD
jgi:hypothetical protein